VRITKTVTIIKSKKIKTAKISGVIILQVVFFFFIIVTSEYYARPPTKILHSPFYL